MEIFGGRGFYSFFDKVGSFIGGLGFVWSVMGRVGVLALGLLLAFL